jgi:hypothetical protein
MGSPVAASEVPALTGPTVLALENLPAHAPPQQSSSTELIVAPEVALMKVPTAEGTLAVKTEPASVLSPSQVRTFLDCQARWWFKYGLQLPDRKTSSLALGLAIHRALELNFREKIETREDLDTAGVVMIFRDAWMEQAGQTEFSPEESQQDLRRVGERLVDKYMDEVAPKIDPAAVELDVQGEIAGVAVRGRVDLLDIEGRLIDIKTASRRPSWVSPDYAFQLATYRQITPGASGEARIDCLVKTNTPQIVQQSYTVGAADLQATRVIFPLVREAMGSGTYCPNRQSILCSQKHCGFWKHCEQEYGGRVRPAV